MANGRRPTTQVGGALPTANTLAIVALATSFLSGPVGISCGVIALTQIKRTGERGNTLAIIGIVVGALSVLGWIAIAAFPTVLFTSPFAVCSELGPGIYRVDGNQITCD